VTKARVRKMPTLTPLEALAEAAECLRTLAHPHRLRMVQMLLRGRYAVGELAEACGIASPLASEHLRLMQRSGFLAVEREGRKAYYRVAEPHLADIMACVEGRFGGGMAGAK
jgi:DNA-binding transcriptional ArsR family regulator